MTTLSVLDLFSIGIGPSSSHTVGPMRAARRFTQHLEEAGVLSSLSRIRVELFGSLAATGVGHGSDTAVILGLAGHAPETVDPDEATPVVERAVSGQAIELPGGRRTAFHRSEDIVFRHGEFLPAHPNGLRITAYEGATPVVEREYFSVGGGFILEPDELSEAGHAVDGEGEPGVEPSEPYPFSSAAELLAHCRVERLTPAQVMLANELSMHEEGALRSQLLGIWRVMQECVENGCTRTESHLPGALRVRRRAPQLRWQLDAREAEGAQDPLSAMEWVNLYALAVNEENAAGGRIVTAPTNGAAGIIPAVLHYCARFLPDVDDDAIVDFLLTAGAIGKLFKLNASISGAEVGCQGEVGSACSMAAGALCAVMGGTPEQVENAAEIGLEHHLGLTCDPVGGLVQVPCIERNAIAAVKAINAARLAMGGDGDHRVSLDQAIETMRQTGADMMFQYKETSLAGLAVNVTEC